MMKVYVIWRIDVWSNYSFCFSYQILFVFKKTSNPVKCPLNTDEIVVWCASKCPLYTVSAKWVSVIQSFFYIVLTIVRPVSENESIVNGCPPYSMFVISVLAVFIIKVLTVELNLNMTLTVLTEFVYISHSWTLQ